MALAVKCNKGHSYIAPDIVGNLPKGAPVCPECRAEWNPKNIPHISTWRGKPVSEYSKDELIVIIGELGKSLEQERKHARANIDFYDGIFRQALTRM